MNQPFSTPHRIGPHSFRFAASLWMSALLLLAAPLHAADPIISYVDHTATGSNDGTSWTDAFTSLQDALTAGTPADEIWVAEGSYYPDEGTGQTNDDRNSTFTLIDDVEIYGGFPNGGSPFAERDPSAHPSILSGDLAKNDEPDFVNNDENAYHVLIADGVTASTALDGFTITAGNATGSSSLNYGGGLYCSGLASPSINNCSFLGNRATFGGGIYNSSSSPTINNCSFAGNWGNAGGGVCNSSSSSPAISNCSFSGNSSNYGGGLYNSQSTPTLNNCSFSGNSAR